ncbi:phospholipase A2 inhibitor and Ly6/PLAUR domain-containing protein-like [Discoglossus pictus]
MISHLVLLFVLSEIATPGYSLSCTECQGTSSCTGSSVTCTTGQVCLSLYISSSVGGVSIESFSRSCGLQSECNIQRSLSNSDLKMKYGSSCCNTDNCTPSTPTLPSDSSQLNGQVCQSCVSASSTWCYSGSTVKCTGNETMCALQSTSLSGSQAAIRGCATKSICDLSSSSIVQYSCTSGSIGLHSGFFFPACVALAMLKLLF